MGNGLCGAGAVLKKATGQRGQIPGTPLLVTPLHTPAACPPAVASIRPSGFVVCYLATASLQVAAHLWACEHAGPKARLLAQGPACRLWRRCLAALPAGAQLQVTSPSIQVQGQRLHSM